MDTYGPTTSRRLVHGIAGVVIAIGAALGSGAVAKAEQPDWDIEVYDNCMKKTIRDPAVCCVASGGDMTDDDSVDGGIGCRAPVRDAENVPGQSSPVGPSKKPTLPYTPGGAVGLG
jgi:hypothetical protein